MHTESVNPHRLSRRDLLKAGAGAAAALALPGCIGPTFSDQGMRSSVAILRAGYDNNLLDVIESGFALIPPPEVTGKRVLLKPNLVDLPRDGKPVCTDPAVIVAVAEAFRRLGAAEIIVGDGPALQRDAWQIVDAIGLTPLLTQHNLKFIDLNTDDLVLQANAGSSTGLPQLYYGRTVWEADVLVSLPKMKTHHWAGASLSMKNLFGTLPTVVYGSPRNLFHLRNLHNAVLDFNRTRPADYAIVDGVTGLEGDGPVRGTPIDVGAIVMGTNLPAVDATSARIMGLRPEAIVYLQRAAGSLGPIGESSIEQRGETIASVQRKFAVVPNQAAVAV
jgi:uncharacterized protein (DUF362 family)